MNAFFSQAQLLGQGSWFYDLLPAQRFVLLLSVLGCVTIALVTTVCVVCAAVQSSHRDRAEADLKREMLDRGMTAEDIARVIESKTPESFLDRWASNQGKKKSA